MCGIAGIIDKNGKSITLNEIKQMTDAIIHRGPDGEGFFVEKNFAFGHRRLSIIDLSEKASQPMHYLQKYTIVFNGEIYNYIEIKDQLIKQNYTFSSESDTEVILAAYDYWGESCVEHFNGMWAFALYDNAKQQIFCSRDRFGIKPFYFCEIGDRLCFGSEIKQLLPFLPENLVNKQILLDYLFIGIEEYNRQTFFMDIQKLPQGHTLIYDLKSGSYKIKPYYEISIDEEIGKLNFNEAKDRFKGLFEDSINLRLRSDVKVGSCLSGGLDSSSIAVTAAQKFNAESTDDKFGAVHARSIEKNTDESNFAQIVAETANLDLHFTSPGQKDFEEILMDVIKIQEEPFGSPSIMMQYFVFQKAKEEGLIVMLDGQGGDELLLGYDRYFVAWLHSNKGISKISNFRRIISNSKLSSLLLLKYYLYFSNSKVRKAKIRRKFNFIKEEYLKQLNTDLLHEVSHGFHSLTRLQKDEVLKYQLPHLLKYEDKNSMAHSIESRLPFLDYRLLEFALSLPPDYKIKKGWSKYILRKSMDNQLDKEVLW
ncbi:MAG: asparagine synthase (glutamine-hydrolyzing), partial [Bacteroidales bacterium]|nr:asparagine synthase (glutamine-hydrolyzing) [Bacteroidales bacterium]